MLGFLNNHDKLESMNDALSPSVVLLRLANDNVEFGEELKFLCNIKMKLCHNMWTAPDEK